ncbi:M14 family zinc carboxypeptidase [Metabacillus litoralis]|uniref:M14 family zinc carboxypeptidase n=1 Tax=Metabacillus litoralis TaxID=152268 RepID=UPI001CFF45F8|nr:M14 family zinc carboxypeptidase [Metabacillus litoralis]
MKKIFHCFMIIFLLVHPIRSTATEMYTYERMENHLKLLSHKYNLEMKSIGHTEFGREIYAIKLGEGKKNVLITGSHHGREWLTTHIIMEMLKNYTAAYDKKYSLYGHSLNILDRVSIWFVPMVNPDGVTIQQKGVEHLPLSLQEIYIDMNGGENNFKRWKANGKGVDLNRQYPAGWKEINGNTPYASYSHYKGEKPFSASETKSLFTFTEEIKPLASVAYHTSGREVFWYYFNSLENLQRDSKLATMVSDVTGYKISYPPGDALGGGYTDWFIQNYQKPAMTIELSYLVDETNPPLSVFHEEWDRNKSIGLILAEYAEKYVKR